MLEHIIVTTNGGVAYPPRRERCLFDYSMSTNVSFSFSTPRYIVSVSGHSVTREWRRWTDTLTCLIIQTEKGEGDFSRGEDPWSSQLSPDWRRIFLSSQRKLTIRCRWSTVLCSSENNCLHSSTSHSICSQRQWQTHTRTDLVHAFRPRRIPRQSQCAERQSSGEFHRTVRLTSPIRSSEPS